MTLLAPAESESMSKRLQIEQALWEIDGATFQRLGDAYLRRRGYPHINPLGLAFGRAKLRISAEVDHPFRSKPITRFGRSRSLVSVQADHPFRSKPITCFG
ncbi:hypothetical protein [Gemmatimonas sp.]|uniref:hypothetical protein n=1 Tax=Gemmatimonas sp. TaxID=1962908 RepID=UPI003DA5A4A3